MIELNIPDWKTAVKVIEREDNLPLIDGITNLYLDIETTSLNPKLHSKNPHRNCKILGVAVLFGTEIQPYYIPVRHYYLGENEEHLERSGQFANISPERVSNWLRALLQRTKLWINQNIKYDVHVLYNEFRFMPQCQLIDTLILAKLSEFQEQYKYSLDRVMSLFGVDITHYERGIKQHLGKGIHDYGLIPPDAMAVYAAVDVLSCRHIYKNVKIHKDCERVLHLEHQLLPQLVRMEQTGLHVDGEKIAQDCQNLVPQQEERLKKIREIADYPDFDPSKKKSLEELFCNKLGWNLDFTTKSIERSNGSGDLDDLTPSFGHDSIYKHRKENPELVDTWVEYTKTEKLLNAFMLPYLETHINDLGLIKPEINQILSTGRTSCKQPNAQQLPPKIRTYILPYTDDYVLVEFDLSQIEFRTIVHYIQNKRCIDDFNNDPKADFHVWVANMCGIGRYPAKRMNFMLGYGGGKDKTVQVLCQLEEIMALGQDMREIRTKAEYIYDSYHRALPELKPTQRKASGVWRAREHMRTLLGRHRNIPHNFHYLEMKTQGRILSKAFNTVNQGSAADFQKDITVRLARLLSRECLLHMLVHDCWIFSIHKKRVKELVPEIEREIQKPIEGIEFSVPILCKYKMSEKNWGDCE